MDSHTRQTKQRKRAGIAVLILLSTGFALLAGECLVRLMLPQALLRASPGLYLPDDELGLRHQPGHRGLLTNGVEYETPIEIDALGLRGPVPPAPANARVALVIGDSFVFGQGVRGEQTLAARLQSELTQRHAAVRVLNAGVRGYGTVQEAAWLRRVGGQVKPALVVLGVFLGNDLQDNAAAPDALRQQFAPGGQWHSFATTFLYQNSHLYRALRAAWLLLSGTERSSRQRWLLSNFGVREGPARDRYPDTAAALQKVAQVARALDARLLALLIPDATQVVPAFRAVFDAERAASEPARVDIDNPRLVFSALLAEVGIETIDLTGPFAERIRAGAQLYLPVDRYWNAEGHAAAAQIIAPRVGALLEGR